MGATKLQKKPFECLIYAKRGGYLWLQRHLQIIENMNYARAQACMNTHTHNFRLDIAFSNISDVKTYRLMEKISCQWNWLIAGCWYWTSCLVFVVSVILAHPGYCPSTDNVTSSKNKLILFPGMVTVILSQQITNTHTKNTHISTIVNTKKATMLADRQRTYFVQGEVRVWVITSVRNLDRANSANRKTNVCIEIVFHWLVPTRWRQSTHPNVCTCQQGEPRNDECEETGRMKERKTYSCSPAAAWSDGRSSIPVRWHKSSGMPNGCHLCTWVYKGTRGEVTIK